MQGTGDIRHSKTAIPYKVLDIGLACLGAVKSRFHCRSMAGVHSAECTISARMVSGQKSGYSFWIIAAMRATWAVAALVSPVIVK